MNSIFLSIFFNFFFFFFYVSNFIEIQFTAGIIPMFDDFAKIPHRVD